MFFSRKKQTKTEKPNELFKSKYTLEQPFYIFLSKYTVSHISSISFNLLRSQHLRHHKSHSLRQDLPMDRLGHRAEQQPNHGWVHHASDFQAAGRGQLRLPACPSGPAPCSRLWKPQLKAHIPRRIKHLPNSSSSDPWSLNSLSLSASQPLRSTKDPQLHFHPFSFPTNAIIKIK